MQSNVNTIVSTKSNVNIFIVYIFSYIQCIRYTITIVSTKSNVNIFIVYRLRLSFLNEKYKYNYTT